MSPKRKREQRMITAAIALIFMVVLISSSLLLITLMFNPASKTAIMLTGESQDPLLVTIAVPPTHPTATP
jgi:hypothetical protein